MIIDATLPDEDAFPIDDRDDGAARRVSAQDALRLGERVAELVLPLYDDGITTEDVDALWEVLGDETALTRLRELTRERLGEAPTAA